MELAPVPRRRLLSRPVWVVLAVIVLAPVTVLALLPTAFGLERYVLSGDSSSSAGLRGSVAFEQRVPSGSLVRGDVVTFAVDPDDPERAALLGDEQADPRAAQVLVTRQVLRLDGGDLVVALDEQDPSSTATVDLSEQPTMSRVVFTIPYIGYAFLGGLSRPIWAVLCLGIGLLLGWIGAGPLRLGRRREARDARETFAVRGAAARARRDRHLAA